MKIKKIILAAFIVISLSFSYQPVNIYSKEKEFIVIVMDCKKDNYTDDFINKNETKKYFILVSLTFRAMIANKGEILFNTS